MKTHHLQPGVGHYGVFNGRLWETQVYPVLRNHIRSSRLARFDACGRGFAGPSSRLNADRRRRGERESS
jgi:hypothetical protein